MMHNLKSQMLWDCIEKQDLSGVVNLLQKGDINLEERDLVCKDVAMLVVNNR